MATASVTTTFVALTTAQAAQVNQNFSDLVSFLNNQVAHVDGSKAFTAIPTLPASNPTTANQAARKAYVDLFMPLTGGTFTGNVTIPTGSAAAPPVRFSGDTNTGLYHSAADTLGLSAGGISHLLVDGVNDIVRVIFGDDVDNTEGSGYLAIGSISGAHMALDTNEIQAKSSGTAYTTLNLNILGGDITLGQSAGSQIILLRGTNVRFPDLDTTASAANAVISSTAKEIRESTSSLRFKDIATDIDPERAKQFVREVDPFLYRSLSPSDNPDTLHAGFGAEHLHDAGFQELVTYKDGKPWSVQYERISVYHQIALRELLAA